MQIDSFWIRWILIHFVLSMAVVIKWISSSFACESFQNLIGPNFLKLLNIGEQKIDLFCSLNGSCDKVNKFVFCMWILPELYGVECSFSVWFGKKLGLFQTIRGNDEIEGTIHVSCVKKAKVTFSKTNKGVFFNFSIKMCQMMFNWSGAPCKTALPIQPIYHKNGPHGLNWQCSLAGM